MFKHRPKEHQRYDAWLQCNTASKCNITCEYCFVDNKKDTLLNEFRASGIGAGSMKVVDSYMNFLSRNHGFRINIDALMRVMEQTGLVFHVGFTGTGEPLLVPNIIEACERISQKHYVTLFTNLTSSKVQEFCDRIDPDRVITICASLHIKELEKRRLLNKYITNFLLLKNKGFPVFADEVAYPPLAREAEHYREFFRKQGMDLHFSSYRGIYQGKDYPKAYTPEEMEAFHLMPGDIERHYQKGKICNAGHNVGIVTLSGGISSCYSIPDNIGHLNDRVVFRNKPIICPKEKCDCPLNSFDPRLFHASLVKKD